MRSILHAGLESGFYGQIRLIALVNMTTYSAIHDESTAVVVINPIGLLKHANQT